MTVGPEMETFSAVRDGLEPRYGDVVPVLLPEA